MPALIDLTGKRFGRLLVVSRAANHHHPRWRCLCDCGTEKVIPAFNLRRGTTNSCGCLHREQLSARVTTHGHNRPGRRSRTYRAWARMKQRGCDPGCSDYPDYGGRGITVCARWRDSFEHFLADVGAAPSAKHSIDRTTGSLGYWCGKPECPECGPGGRAPNCRWATAKQQARNTCRNRNITLDGQTHCVSEWAEIKGLPASTIHARLARGWDERRAVTTPRLRPATNRRR